jgi:hypothetical protein
MKNIEVVNSEITYFPTPGPQNTEMTLNLAKKRAEALGIVSVIVASTGGRTGAMAAEIFREYNLIVVTHSTGFMKADAQEFTDDNRRKIIAAGAKILTCQHAFGGVGRAVRKKLGTYELEELVAYTLRLFGEGTKVACEMALMVADAGLVRTDEEVLSIGGTGHGADTALVLQPTNAQTFFDMRIKEILCKPRL